MKTFQSLKRIINKSSQSNQMNEKKDEREYDYEGDMAMSQLRSIIRNAQEMHDKLLEPTSNLPEWVQSKITLAQDYIETAANYLSTEMDEAVKEPTGDLKDACWKGYTAVGFKKKNGRRVPNCVPIKEEAENKSNKKLGKVTRLPAGSAKKFQVHVKNDKGNTISVKFGDPGLEIKRDDPGRRKNFRARHNCDTDPKAKDRTRPKYWSCRQWRAGAKVEA